MIGSDDFVSFFCYLTLGSRFFFFFSFVCLFQVFWFYGFRYFFLKILFFEDYFNRLSFVLVLYLLARLFVQFDSIWFDYDMI